jgi:hypothetical protein
MRKASFIDTSSRGRLSTRMMESNGSIKAFAPYLLGSINTVGGFAQLDILPTSYLTPVIACQARADGSQDRRTIIWSSMICFSLKAQPNLAVRSFDVLFYCSIVLWLLTSLIFLSFRWLSILTVVDAAIQLSRPVLLGVQ